MQTMMLSKRVANVKCRSTKNEGGDLGGKPAAFVKRATDRKKEMEDDRYKKLSAMHEQVKVMWKDEIDYVKKLWQETSEQHGKLCEACHQEEKKEKEDNTSDSLLKDLEKEEEMLAQQQSSTTSSAADVFVDKSTKY